MALLTGHHVMAPTVSGGTVMLSFKWLLLMRMHRYDQSCCCCCVCIMAAAEYRRLASQHVGSHSWSVTLHPLQVLRQGLGKAMQKLERSLPPTRSPSPVRQGPPAVEAC